MRNFRSALLPAVVGAALSCGEGPTAVSPKSVLFTIDRTSYVATSLGGIPGGQGQYAFQIIARVQNRSDHPIYFDRCYPSSTRPVFGVSLVAPPNPEGSAYDPTWACVGHDSPIIVEAGALRVDTLRIVGPNSVDGVTKRPIGQAEGIFELRYGVSVCRVVTVACSRFGQLTFRPRFTVTRQS